MNLILRTCSPRRLFARSALLFLWMSTVPVAVSAEESADASLDALFGDALEDTSTKGDFKAAADALKSVPPESAALSVKSEFQAPDHRAELVHAFAAQRVLLSTQKGCVSSLPKGETIGFVELRKLPGASQSFAVCLRIKSEIGRPMSMAVALVDSKNRRIARAKGQIDFTQSPQRDHALQFPSVRFRMYGQHFLVLDLEGKEVGRLPLFDVRKTEPAADQSTVTP